MITYKLRAPSYEDIEQAVPFALYREDEDGNTRLIPATRQYSYVRVGNEIKTEATYDEDGELLSEAEYTGKVLADFKSEKEIDWPDSVDVLNPGSPSHSWCY